MNDPMSARQPRRRSFRLPKGRWDSNGPPHWQKLNPKWRQQYMDLGQSRISTCTQRMMDASEDDLVELRSLRISFLAFAVYMVASASGRARKEKEADLVDYARAVLHRGLPANDEHRRNSAVELAAYNGLTNILTLLLDSGCLLKQRMYKKTCNPRRSQKWPARSARSNAFKAHVGGTQDHTGGREF